MIRSPVVTCTVVTRSHFGYARAMARSLRRWNPDARAYVLVLDCPAGQTEPGMDEVISISLADLEIPDCEAFCFQYTAFELCNALKASLVRHVLRKRGEPAALYLDGDIGVYGSLDSLWEKVRAQDVLLTPHLSAPLPSDGKFPGYINILRAGSFNAGVVGINGSTGGLAFVDWWADRVRHDCVVDHAYGLDCDQRFLDLVPGLFPGHAVLRHDGVNVAHFNMHHRRLRRDSQDQRWYVNQDPLLLFHFTQVRYSDGTFFLPVSRDFGAQSAEMRALAGEFLKDLEASDWTGYSRRSYGFKAFASGRLISRETRAEFRRRWQAGQLTPGNPFSDPEWESFERGVQWRALPGRCLGFLRSALRRLGSKLRPA